MKLKKRTYKLFEEVKNSGLLIKVDGYYLNGPVSAVLKRCVEQRVFLTKVPRDQIDGPNYDEDDVYLEEIFLIFSNIINLDGGWFFTTPYSDLFAFQWKIDRIGLLKFLDKMKYTRIKETSKLFNESAYYLEKKPNKPGSVETIDF